MCYSLWYNTQSSAPEDRRDNCPKHFELMGIINKPLLLHLVGCLYYMHIENVVHCRNFAGETQNIKF